MWYFVCFFCTLSLWAGQLQKENIPHYQKEKSQIIPFAIQKDFSDGSLNAPFLQMLKSFFGIETFIETGTHFGDTAEKAGQIFEEVHTIELFPPFYQLASKRFKNKPNIHTYLGSSEAVLPAIFPRCQGRSFFYLDGHYDGGQESGKGEKNTPILEELAAIRAWGAADAIILIDDISDFQPSLYPDRIQGSCFADYPDLAGLIDAALAINPRYLVCFIPNALLIFPPMPDVTVSSFLRACTIDRLSVIGDLFSEGELLEAEQTIRSIRGAERCELQNYFQAYADFEWNLGWRSFAGFWQALALLEEGKTFQAEQILKQTKKNSLPGWRLDTYSQ